VKTVWSFQGAATCKKKLYTIGQFMDHLADSTPALINRLSEANRTKDEI
jgi:hypothetical protein